MVFKGELIKHQAPKFRIRSIYCCFPWYS